MHAWRYLWLTACALAWALTGCLGGSGSSGFDITENAAIEQVIDTQECQDFEGLLICPADTGPLRPPSATPTPTPTPTTTIILLPPTAGPETPGPDTATPTLVPVVPSATATVSAATTPTRMQTPGDGPEMQVDTNVNSSSDIRCPSSESIPCTFPFIYVAKEFPAGAAFRTASRQAADGPWTISQPTDLTDTRPDHASFADAVPIDAAANAPAESATVQFAVLVFLTDPGLLPPTVASLGDTHADFAYVLPTVPVSTVGLR